MLYTVLDIETSGLNRELDNILEVGYIQMNKKCEILRKGNFYFWQPGWKAGATHIHGLTEGFLQQFEGEFQDNLIKLFTVFANSIIIGKNSNRFDIPFIQNFIRKYAGPLYPVDCRATLDLEPYYAPHYRKWYHEQTGEWTNRKGSLEELIPVIGMTDAQVKHMYLKDIDCERARAHGALYDTYMTYLLTKYAVENYGMNI